MRPTAATINGPAIIDIRHLTHRFPDRSLGLDDVTLTILEGEFVILAGPNGSGKSTLLRHLNGLLAPSRGTVYLKGLAVDQDYLRARRLVGMIFQDADSQIVGETVWEDAAFGPRNLGFETPVVRDKVAAALETVGIAHLADKPPHLLSGGEKRRLAIAGVLAMGPQVLAFDEPFSNLDFRGTCSLVKQMQRLHHQGHTLVVATHELDRVHDLANRLVILNDGRIVQNGDPSDILPRVLEFGLKPLPGEAGTQGERPWHS